jgi:SAM-dependent methyltransferase
MAEFTPSFPQLVGLRAPERATDRILKNELREYEDESVQKTLDNAYVPKPILEARKRQDQFLLERFKGKPLAIADIGCGDGYHGEIFAPDCVAYDGFEISEAMAQKTNDRWTAHGLKNAHVTQCDAGSVPLKPDHYDVAWSLYFTSGNFRDELKLEEYTDEYLDENPKFIKIISNFFKALKPGGRLLLTVYKDKPETEKAQRTFYQKTGQTLVTSPGSRFVSTQENFWSVRWTKKSMLSNLKACGIGPDQVTFHDLNAVSWIVEVEKR